mgnify:CR=1 FL=1
MASDFCEDMGIALPALDCIAGQVSEVVPGVQVVNPLDMTGFTVGNAEASMKLLRAYAESDAVDTLLLQWFVDEGGVEHGAAFLNAFAEIAGTSRKALMLASLEDGEIGEWAGRLPATGAAVARGLPGTLRSLQSMGRFVRRAREPHPAVLPAGHPVAPPSPAERVSSDAGTMLSFASTMALLEAAGFTVARHRVIAADARTDEVGSAFSGRCVVKLADVPHRTELGAVRLGVLPVEMPRVIDELRDLAGRHGVPATVAIQEQVAGQRSEEHTSELQSH